jgi:hypothetical protein
MGLVDTAEITVEDDCGLLWFVRVHLEGPDRAVNRGVQVGVRCLDLRWQSPVQRASVQGVLSLPDSGGLRKQPRKKCLVSHWPRDAV